MLRGPPLVATVLCLVVFTDLVPASSVRAVSHSVGSTVTLDCLEGSNRTAQRDDTRQITWRKENHLHNLTFVFSKTLNKTASNLTDSRISFQIPEQPLTLRITDAQPSDAGNYTCDVTTSGGVIRNAWTLHVSGGSAQSAATYIYTSVAGAALLIIIIFVVLYYISRSKSNQTPCQIHQTIQESNAAEEPVYDSPMEHYALRFNTLYDSMPAPQVR